MSNSFGDLSTFATTIMIGATTKRANRRGSNQRKQRIATLAHSNCNAATFHFQITLLPAQSSFIDIQLELEPGVGISLIGNDEHGHNEELVYALFSCVRTNIKKSKAIKNRKQLFGADRPNFFFCDPNALNDEPIAMPAMNFEMSYTICEYWDSYDSFRLKSCNLCIFLDEQLLWRLVHLQCSDISLSGTDTDRFVNALATPTPLPMWSTFSYDLKKQKLNIMVAMDAFGNPINFVNELKEGVQGLLFEGDVAGFTFGLGYGAAANQRN